jgi:hypothetical protein
MRRLPALLLPLLVACAPAAQHTGETPAPAAQAATAAPAAGILGDYTATLSESDLSATAPQEARRGAVGTWGLAFHQGNHFVVTHNGRQVVEGPYEVRGNQIVFATGESGPYACNAPATYTWRVSNGQLTFTPVGQDTCQGRVLAITSRPFTRTP